MAARQPEADQQLARGRGPRQVGRRQRRLLHRAGVLGAVRPVLEGDARGVFAGLTRYVNRGHIARATLEATAFQSREVSDAMNADSGVELESLKVDGGMVVNETLMQFQADILGVPVIRPKVAETTALGAATRPVWRPASGARRKSCARTGSRTSAGSPRCPRRTARRRSNSGRRPSRGPSIGPNNRRTDGCCAGPQSGIPRSSRPATTPG